MHLIAASTLFLIVAGSLEGMVSPIPYWPLELKLIVSATTLVLMIAYLRGGIRRRKALPRRTPADDELLALRDGYNEPRALTSK